MLQRQTRDQKFDCNKNVVFDCTKNFAHALIQTCAGGNVFFYYTKGHAVSLTAIFTHVVGNRKQTYFLGWYYVKTKKNVERD